MRIIRAIGLTLHSLFPFLLPFLEFFKGRTVFGLFRYLRDISHFRKQINKSDDGNSSVVLPIEIFPCLADRYESAGELPRHYFWQDIWAAKKVFQEGVDRQFDIGSRLDGFIANCLSFCEVVMLDVRPLPHKVKGLRFLQTDCTDMSTIDSDSIASLSSLHAIEHFGLGRYGDEIDPKGHEKVIKEIRRIVSPGGMLLISVPIGRERIEFNAHRVFSPTKLSSCFPEFDLLEFSVVDDENVFLENKDTQAYEELEYGCGLFQFRKRLESS